MAHDRDQIAADAATVSKGLCPECFVTLTSVDPRSHAEGHWPETTLDPRIHGDAIRRKRLVNRYADAAAKKE